MIYYHSVSPPPAPSRHSVILSWLWASQSLPNPNNADRHARKRQVSILKSLVWLDQGSNPAESGFEPVMFGFPDLPSQEAGALLILTPSKRSALFVVVSQEHLIFPIFCHAIMAITNLIHEFMTSPCWSTHIFSNAVLPEWEYKGPIIVLILKIWWFIRVCSFKKNRQCTVTDGINSYPSEQTSIACIARMVLCLWLYQEHYYIRRRFCHTIMTINHHL